jgi:hypothetical protein
MVANARWPVGQLANSYETDVAILDGSITYLQDRIFRALLASYGYVLLGFCARRGTDLVRAPRLPETHAESPSIGAGSIPASR